MNDAALRSKRLESLPTVDHHTSERETDLPPTTTATITAGSVENSSSSLTQTEARPVGKVNIHNVCSCLILEGFLKNDLGVLFITPNELLIKHPNHFLSFK